MWTWGHIILEILGAVREPERKTEELVRNDTQEVTLWLYELVQVTFLFWVLVTSL